MSTRGRQAQRNRPLDEPGMQPASVGRSASWSTERTTGIVACFTQNKFVSFHAHLLQLCFRRHAIGAVGGVIAMAVEAAEVLVLPRVFIIEFRRVGACSLLSKMDSSLVDMQCRHISLVWTKRIILLWFFHFLVPPRHPCILELSSTSPLSPSSL